MMDRWKVTTLYCLGFVLGSIFSLTYHRGPFNERVLGLALLLGLMFYLLERRLKVKAEKARTVQFRRSADPKAPKPYQDPSATDL